MTKKDYELIADSVRRSLLVLTFGKNQAKRLAAEQGIRLLANDLAGSFYGENRKFDRNKFLLACGVED